MLWSAPCDCQSPESRGCVLFSWVSSKLSTNPAECGHSINVRGIPGYSAYSPSNYMAGCLCTGHLTSLGTRCIIKMWVPRLSDIAGICSQNHA